MATVRQLISQGTKTLYGVSMSPRLDVEVLLCAAADMSRTDLIVKANEPVADNLKIVFFSFLDRRKNQEPVAYITGIKEFWGLDFNVTPDVLIPRPETELLVSKAVSILEEFSAPLNILEIGTGSGCIVTALASELSKQNKEFQITALDISKAALEVAEDNARKHCVQRKIRFLQSDLFAEVPEGRKFQLIISNPPYVEAGSEDVSPETRYEPDGALYSGKDGLDLIRKLITEVPGYLKTGGRVLLEIGSSQKEAIRGLVEVSDHFSCSVCHQDLAGLDRVVELIPGSVLQ